VWPNLRYFPSIFMEELRGKKISGRIVRLGLELGVSHYNSEMLPFDLIFMSSTQYLSVT